jgi:hypothetical protein
MKFFRDYLFKIKKMPIARQFGHGPAEIYGKTFPALM